GDHGGRRKRHARGAEQAHGLGAEAVADRGGGVQDRYARRRPVEHGERGGRLLEDRRVVPDPSGGKRGLAKNADDRRHDEGGRVRPSSRSAAAMSSGRSTSMQAPTSYP